MGLDMYLTKRTYIGAEYSHRKIKGNINITRDGNPIKIDFNKISHITERAAYWRKANQIHNWFVENVQKGEDDCGEYFVSKEQLKELYELCLEVKSKAIIEEGKVISNSEEIEELLSTSSGFFFGGTDYDERYLNDINHTLEALKPIIEEEEENFDSDYFYRSSW